MDYRRKSLRLQRCATVEGGVNDKRFSTGKDTSLTNISTLIDLEASDSDDFVGYPGHIKLHNQNASSSIEKMTIDHPESSTKILTADQEVTVVEEETEKLEDNVIEHEEKYLDSTHIRVSPKVFIKMVSSMSEAQKAWVNETGFGDIINFNIRFLPHRLGFKIVSCFDHDTLNLVLPSGNIRVREKDVFEVLGIPLGRRKIDLKHKNDVFENLWRNQFVGIDPHKISAKLILEKMKSSGDVENMFKMNFLIIMTNAFIQSNANACVNKRILRFRGDIDNCAEYNWCELVIDSLIAATPVWKKDPTSKNYTGPLIFLIVLYVDRIIYKHRRTVARSVPTWMNWTTTLLRKRSDDELETDSFGKGLIESGQWNNISNQEVVHMQSPFKDSAMPESTIEKDCLRRLELSASRLIGALANFESSYNVCMSIMPTHPRPMELYAMVKKIIQEIVTSSDVGSKDVGKKRVEGVEVVEDSLSKVNGAMLKKRRTTIAGTSKQTDKEIATSGLNENSMDNIVKAEDFYEDYTIKGQQQASKENGIDPNMTNTRNVRKRRR